VFDDPLTFDRFSGAHVPTDSLAAIQIPHPREDGVISSIFEYDRTGTVQTSGSKGFNCLSCSKSFTRAFTLKEHLRRHEGQRSFKCRAGDGCNKSFMGLRDRNRHEALHSEIKNYVCWGKEPFEASWGCHRRFAREDGLMAHLRTDRGWKCLQPFLNRYISEYAWLRPSMREGKYYCALLPKGSQGCEASFATLNEMKEHFGDANGRNCARKFLISRAVSESSLCQYSLDQKADLEEDDTEVEKNHSCSICQQTQSPKIDDQSSVFCKSAEEKGGKTSQ
jgi:hypothetical protein